LRNVGSNLQNYTTSHLRTKLTFTIIAIKTLFALTFKTHTKRKFSNEFRSINFMLYNTNIFLATLVEELKILQAKTNDTNGAEFIRPAGG
jgi:hypothetical protein